MLQSGDRGLPVTIQYSTMACRLVRDNCWHRLARTPPRQTVAGSKAEFERFQKGARFVRDWLRLVGCAFNVDMNKPSVGAGTLSAIPKKANVILHTGSADLRNAYACMDDIRKRDRRMISAASFNYKANNGTVFYIQNPALDQKLIDRRIKKGIINRIIDMAIGVIVPPARAVLLECLKIAPNTRLWSFTHAMFLTINSCHHTGACKNAILSMQLSLLTSLDDRQDIDGTISAKVRECEEPS